MIRPDFDGARQHALSRLAHELAPELLYHSFAHTCDDVMPAATRLALLEGIDAEDRELLLTAVAFHDIGFVEGVVDHEAIGIRIAAAALPQFGFSDAQIDVVSEIIRATRLPQQPHTLLEEIMADADLDVLGRDDFLVRNEQLRIELVTRGQVMTDAAWYRQQLGFLTSHAYFTRGARNLRSFTKQRNIAALAERLQAVS